MDFKSLFFKRLFFLVVVIGIFLYVNFLILKINILSNLLGFVVFY